MLSLRCLDKYLCHAHLYTVLYLIHYYYYHILLIRYNKQIILSNCIQLTLQTCSFTFLVYPLYTDAAIDDRITNIEIVIISSISVNPLLGFLLLLLGKIMTITSINTHVN